MTREQLISNATAMEAKVDFSESKALGVPMIGICYKDSHTYHWFIQFDDDVYFHHSYSMLTGRTKKGLRHRMRVSARLGVYAN